MANTMSLVTVCEPSGVHCPDNFAAYILRMYECCFSLRRQEICADSPVKSGINMQKIAAMLVNPDTLLSNECDSQ